MTTSGTTSFNLDLTALAEEAFERCGAELRTGYDLKTARRSLNILLIEWANKGYNLWTLEEGSIPLANGTAEYALPVDTVSLAEQFIRQGTNLNQQDITIGRVSAVDWASQPNKNATGRPLQLFFDRQGGQTDPVAGVRYPTVTLWPIPDNDTYTLVTWRLRRVQDAESGLETQDIPFRFLPALVAGLAYHLCKKIPGAIDRVMLLKAEYDELFQAAADEDREKADLRIVPRSAYR
jgi:hypothetical protein